MSEFAFAKAWTHHKQLLAIGLVKETVRPILTILSTFELILWSENLLIFFRNSFWYINNPLRPIKSTLGLRDLIEIRLLWVKLANQTLHDIHSWDWFDPGPSVKLAGKSSSLILLNISLMSESFIHTPINDLSFNLFLNSLIPIVAVFEVLKCLIELLGLLFLIVKCLEYLTGWLLNTLCELWNQLLFQLFLFGKGPTSG